MLSSLRKRLLQSSSSKVLSNVHFSSEERFDLFAGAPGSAKSAMPGLPANASAQLPPMWKRWIAQDILMKKADPDDHGTVDTLCRHGIPPALALAEMRMVRNDPYYQAGEYVAHKLHKIKSLLDVYCALDNMAPAVPEIERKAPMPRQVFLESYYARNRPVIITGLMNRWPAMQKWSGPYFKSVCGNEKVEIMSGRNADPRYEVNSEQHKREIRFADYIDLIARSGHNNDHYLVSNNRFFSRLGVRPLLADIRPFSEYLTTTDIEDYVHLWYGPAGTITPLHHDTMNIFIAQVKGTKRFKLIPSWQSEWVYNSVGVFSDVDCESPDTERFPLFENVTMLDFTLHPGEALFVPVGWWHHVRALEPCITVSFTNFVFPNDFEWFQPTQQPVVIPGSKTEQPVLPQSTDTGGD